MKKTMKKRTNCLLLAMMMACSMMSGCGSSDSGTSNSRNDSTGGTAADNGYDGQASYAPTVQAPSEAPAGGDYDT